MRWVRIFVMTALVAVASLTALAATPTATANTPEVDGTDVVYSGGSEGLMAPAGDGTPTMVPPGYWTCNIVRLVNQDPDGHSMYAYGQNSCNHPVTQMDGQVWLERPLGTVIASGNIFDCSDCSSRSSSTPLVFGTTPGATYWYRYRTTIRVPFGSMWEAPFPPQCSAYREVLNCSYTVSFRAQ